MRIRKKLLLMHTGFSLTLAAILLIALRPPLSAFVARAEADKADTLLQLVARDARDLAYAASDERDRVQIGSAEALGVDEQVAARARLEPGEPVSAGRGSATRRVMAFGTAADARLALAEVRLPGARSAVTRVYLLLIAALLVVYGLIVLALEVLVLPRHVYGPIRAMLRADRAVQEGDAEAELIPGQAIPSDEIGEIMRSRNATVRKLRSKEAELADAIERLERVASDLKRKNHLLENARRNLEGADRLASLGMMSAGIAHELNTPLAVAKGLTERLNGGAGLSPSEADLLRRVIGRLERLGDSLLHFARAEPTEKEPAGVRGLVDEALTLVRLDRKPERIALRNEVPEDLVAMCDGDRIVQVLVNLVRNAVDAERGAGVGGLVRVEGSCDARDGGAWASIRVIDDGPGIDPAVLPRLFEPFVSSRLDAEGTGLGLAVAEGIVREHSGTLIARNRPDGRGAEFEVLLPAGVSQAERDPQGEVTAAREGGGR